MAKTLETSIQKRFSDVDPFQHVNNVSQQMYFDVGKMEYYEKILGDEVLLVGSQNGVAVGIEDLCDILGTIPHELCCGFSIRMPKVYLR